VPAISGPSALPPGKQTAACDTSAAAVWWQRMLSCPIGALPAEVAADVAFIAALGGAL
jgi:hypothetical protein